MKSLIFLLFFLFIEKIATISCIGGRIVSGICKCPKGLKLYSGMCVNKIPVKCEGGTIKDNSCICPARTKLINGRCEKISK